MVPWGGSDPHTKKNEIMTTPLLAPTRGWPDQFGLAGSLLMLLRLQSNGRPFLSCVISQKSISRRKMSGLHCTCTRIYATLNSKMYASLASALLYEPFPLLPSLMLSAIWLSVCRQDDQWNAITRCNVHSPIKLLANVIYLIDNTWVWMGNILNWLL